MNETTTRVDDPRRRGGRPKGSGRGGATKDIHCTLPLADYEWAHPMAVAAGGWSALVRRLLAAERARVAHEGT